MSRLAVASIVKEHRSGSMQGASTSSSAAVGTTANDGPSAAKRARPWLEKLDYLSSSSSSDGDLSDLEIEAAAAAVSAGAATSSDSTNEEEKGGISDESSVKIREPACETPISSSTAISTDSKFQSACVKVYRISIPVGMICDSSGYTFVILSLVLKLTTHY